MDDIRKPITYSELLKRRKFGDTAPYENLSPDMPITDNSQYSLDVGNTSEQNVDDAISAYEKLADYEQALEGQDLADKRAPQGMGDVKMADRAFDRRDTSKDSIGSILGIPLVDAEMSVKRIKSVNRAPASVGIPMPKSDSSVEEPSEKLSSYGNSYFPQRDRYSSQEALLAASDARSRNVLGANLLKATAMMGSAIAGTRPNLEIFDSLAKTADNPIEDFKNKQAAVAQDQKINESQMDLENAEALQDPMHPISQAARDAAKQYLKINLPPDVSAAQLDKAGLLKPLISASRPGQNNKQIIRQMMPDGRVRNVLVDKLTGETSELGEAGFALQSRIDPTTGNLIQVVPSRLGGQVGGGQPQVGGTPELNPVQKKEVGEHLKIAQGSEEYKASEKMLMSTGKVRKLLSDVRAHGGQSLAMLGPQVARAIAGEVGVLTEGDVTRYIKNPTLLGGLQDTLMKLTTGKLSEVSVENLNRMLSLMEQEAKGNRENAYNRASIQLSRVSGLSQDQSKYYINPDAKAVPNSKVGPSGFTPEQRRARILQLKAKKAGIVGGQ